MNKYYLRNKTEILKIMKEHYNNNRVQRIEYQKEYNKRIPKSQIKSYNRNYYLSRKYNYVIKPFHLTINDDDLVIEI